ncbi:transposon Tf2-9 polyprotein [Trichonephila clavipes]|nr:transposon Tf2-9 polyprotein [Trichonephila clavipes]
MNRCPDLVVCLKRDLQCLRPEASLVLIYRPNVAEMKGRVDLAQPVNRTPDLCEGLEIYNTFNLKSKANFSEVLQKFEEYFSPRQNVVYESYKLFSCVQLEGQTIETYVTQLKILASTCEFAEQENGLIRDRIVLGIKDSGLQERLLRENNLNIEKAIDIVRAAEASREQI